MKRSKIICLMFFIVFINLPASAQDQCHVAPIVDITLEEPKLNDAEWLYKAGYRLRHERKDPEDKTRGIKYLDLSADMGHPKAQAEMILFKYQAGEAKKDKQLQAEAIKKFEQAIQLDNVTAAQMLAGIKVKQGKKDEAFQILKSLSDKGIPQAQWEFAKAISANLIPSNGIDSYSLIIRAAEKGNVNALRMLGKTKIKGNTFKQRTEWLKKASLKKDSFSSMVHAVQPFMNNLAKSNFKPLSYVNNREELIKSIKKANRAILLYYAGDISAEGILSLMIYGVFIHGDPRYAGSHLDKVLGLSWLKRFLKFVENHPYAYKHPEYQGRYMMIKKAYSLETSKLSDEDTKRLKLLENSTTPLLFNYCNLKR